MSILALSNQYLDNPSQPAAFTEFKNLKKKKQGMERTAAEI